MKNFYFLEEDDPSCNWTDGEVVALTPKVCSSLIRRKKSYRILEHFYSDEEVHRNETGYFFQQMEWFRSFDVFLKNRIPFLKNNDLNLASAHHNRLIYLIDSFVIRARILESFFISQAPDKIIGVSALTTPGVGEPSVYNFSHPDRFSLFRLLPLFEKRYGAKCEFLSLAKATSPKRRRSRPVALLAGFKRFRDYFRYCKFLRLVAVRSSFRNIACFVPEIGSSSFDLVYRGLIQRGCLVFIGDGRRNRSLDISYDGDSIWRDFESSDLLTWHNRFSPIELQDLLKPYLEHFIKQICPEVIRDTAALVNFFKQKKIRAVISRASVGKPYTAPLLAAAALKIPRICFQHSTGPVDMKSWVVDELMHFDYNFAMCSASKAYFQSQSKLLPQFHVSVYEYSGYLKQIAASSTKYRTKLQKKPVLLYCPHKLPSGVTHFNTHFYSITWYFEFQLKILRYLGKQTPFFIIYKPSDGQGFLTDTIALWLQQQGFRDLIMETRPLTRYFPKVNRVLLDFPSTGLFETTAARIPTLCLYHHTVPIWPPMKQVFQKILQPFNDHTDAIEKTERFLEAPPEDFLINLPLNDQEPYSYLGKILQTHEPDKRDL